MGDQKRNYKTNKLINLYYVTSHGYAEDLQICGHCDTGQTGQLISMFSNYVDEVKNWMASNRLRLNPDKTELIWLASSRRLDQCPAGSLLVSGAHVKPSMKVRHLGVYIDSDLSLSSHISQVTSTCFYNIRQLRLVRRSLTEETSEALVCSFIHSRLDYCSAILAGQPDYIYKCLQSVLRSAARLVLKLASCDSRTDLMWDRLHWLCFPYRVTFKLCVLAYKCQHGLAPGYLARFCRPVSTVAYRSRLRSAAAGQLEVPLIHTVTYGERNFAYSCPTAWNNLPSELKRLHQEMSLHTFKKALKTHFFSIARIA